MIRKVALVAYLSLLSSPAWGQDIAFGQSALGFQDCSRALLLEEVSQSSSLAVQLSSLRLIKKSDFLSIQAGLDSSSTAIVYGIPVTKAMGFDAFFQKRQELFERHEFHFNQSQSFQYSRAFLNDNSKEAYVSCLRHNEQLAKEEFNSQLFTARVEFADEEIVRVLLKWNPSPFPKAVDLEPISYKDLFGSSQELEELDTINKLSVNGSHPITIKRAPGKDFSLTITAAGLTQTVEVPADPALRHCEVEVTGSFGAPWSEARDIRQFKLRQSQEKPMYDGPSNLRVVQGHNVHGWCSTNDECEVQAHMQVFNGEFSRLTVWDRDGFQKDEAVAQGAYANRNWSLSCKITKQIKRLGNYTKVQF